MAEQLTIAAARVKAAGTQSFPGVTVDDDALCAYLATRESKYHADLFLCCALLQGSREAHNLFDERYLAHAALYLAKFRPAPEVLDEVKQRVRERLLVDGKIEQYSGEGPLAAWLRAVCVRTLRNVTRQSRDFAEIESERLVDAAQASPEVQVLRARMNTLFKAALRDAFAELREDERLVLRLRFVEELTLDALARVLDVHRATVARKLADAHQSLWRSVTNTLARELRVEPEQIEAYAQELRSKLEITLSGLIR